MVNFLFCGIEPTWPTFNRNLAIEVSAEPDLDRGLTTARGPGNAVLPGTGLPVVGEGGYAAQQTRFMQATAERPASTWNEFEVCFGPYSAAFTPRVIHWLVAYVLTQSPNNYLIAAFPLDPPQPLGPGETLWFPPGDEQATEGLFAEMM